MSDLQRVAQNVTVERFVDEEIGRPDLMNPELEVTIHLSAGNVSDQDWERFSAEVEAGRRKNPQSSADLRMIVSEFVDDGGASENCSWKRAQMAFVKGRLAKIDDILSTFPEDQQLAIRRAVDAGVAAGAVMQIALARERHLATVTTRHKSDKGLNMATERNKGRRKHGTEWFLSQMKVRIEDGVSPPDAAKQVVNHYVVLKRRSQLPTALSEDGESRVIEARTAKAILLLWSRR